MIVSTALVGLEDFVETDLGSQPVNASVRVDDVLMH